MEIINNVFKAASRTLAIAFVTVSLFACTKEENYLEVAGNKIKNLSDVGLYEDGNQVSLFNEENQQLSVLKQEGTFTFSIVNDEGGVELDFVSDKDASSLGAGEEIAATVRYGGQVLFSGVTMSVVSVSDDKVWLVTSDKDAVPYGIILLRI